MTISIRLNKDDMECIDAISDYMKEQHYISYNKTDIIKFCIVKTALALPENYCKNLMPFKS